ncbi:MAG: hypothetical protein P8N58_06930 [Emcibacteraceae bacterium]|nr:hypothetical protein [Emcibacteraceae bacterium]
MRAPVARAAFSHMGLSAAFLVPLVVLGAMLSVKTEFFGLTIAGVYQDFIAIILYVFMSIPIVCFVTIILLRRNVKLDGWELLDAGNSVPVVPSLHIALLLTWGFYWRLVLLNLVIGFLHMSFGVGMEAAYEFSVLAWALAFVWLIKFPYGRISINIFSKEAPSLPPHISFNSSAVHSLKISLWTIFILTPVLIIWEEKATSEILATTLLFRLIVPITPALLLFINKSRRVKVWRDNHPLKWELKGLVRVLWGYMWRYVVVYGLTLPFIQNDLFFNLIQNPLMQLGFEWLLFFGITFIRTGLAVLWFEMLPMGSISFRESSEI